MRTLLLVTYSFPPVGGGGVIRATKFCKYLAHFGWNVVVVTPRHRSKSKEDASLLDDLPPAVEVCRIPLPRVLLMGQRDYSRDASGKGAPWRRPLVLARAGLKFGASAVLVAPDGKVAWVPRAIRECERLLARRKIDVVMTTSPPPSVHLVGHYLKLWGNVPWVMDFRDDWIENPLFSSRFPHQAVVNKWLDRRCLRRADRVIATTEAIERRLRRRAGRTDDTRFLTITNGFDPEDMQGWSEPLGDRFTISHLGSLFSGERTARYFLAGMRCAIDRFGVPADDISVRFLGGLFGSDRELVATLHLAKTVEITEGLLPHSAALRRAAASHVLLVILTPEGDGTVICPGKIFEYLALRRPIFAAVPEGYAAELIRTLGVGIVAPYADSTAIARSLADLYRRYRKGTLGPPRLEADITVYDRRRLAQQLAEVLDDV